MLQRVALKSEKKMRSCSCTDACSGERNEIKIFESMDGEWGKGGILDILG
jgi:hypothetical protein